MRSLIAQFKQKRSSGPIQAGTSCSCNSNDFRKKVNKGNLNVNGWDKTKDHNDDDISIHATGDEIEDNANKREQESNVLGAGDHDPLSLYSSKVRSDDEEYSSDDDKQGKGKYQDLLYSVQEEMGSPVESEFPEACGKIWGKAKPKGRSGDELKNILIPSNCSYLKSPYLNSEIYNKLHDVAINRDKGAQRKQRAYVNATIPLMQVVFNLKEIEKKPNKELSKETFSNLRDISPLLHQSIRMQNVLFTETQRKRKYDVCSILGKNFRCYCNCPSTEDYLFYKPTIKKMCQDLKHSEGKRQKYSKNTCGPNKSYKGHHYKGKTYDNRPSQQTTKLQQEEK